MNLTFTKMNVLFMKGNNLENFLKEGYVFIKYFLCAGIISIFCYLLIHSVLIIPCEVGSNRNLSTVLLFLSKYKRRNEGHLGGSVS